MKQSIKQSMKRGPMARRWATRRTAGIAAVVGALSVVGVAGIAGAGGRVEPRRADPIGTDVTLPPGIDSLPVESLPALPPDTEPPPPSTIALPPLQLQPVATLPNVDVREAFAIGDKLFIVSNSPDTANQIVVVASTGASIKSIMLGESDRVSGHVVVGGDTYVLVDEGTAEGTTRCTVRKVVPAALDLGPSILLVDGAACTVALADPTRPNRIWSAHLEGDPESEELATASMVDLDLSSGATATADFREAIPSEYSLDDVVIAGGAVIVEVLSPIDDNGEPVKDSAGKTLPNKFIKVVPGQAPQTLDFQGEAYHLGDAIYVRVDSAGTSQQLDPVGFTLTPMSGKSPEPQGDVQVGDNAFTATMDHSTLVVVQRKISTATDVARGLATVEVPEVGTGTATMAVVGSDVFAFANSTGFDNATGANIASTAMFKVVPVS